MAQAPKKEGKVGGSDCHECPVGPGTQGPLAPHRQPDLSLHPLDDLSVLSVSFRLPTEHPAPLPSSSGLTVLNLQRGSTV